MQSLSEPFIRRPVMTLLLTLSIFVSGIFCYRYLPVGALPNVDYPVIQVSAGFSGMDPESMAANIATPLEKEFMTIEGIESLSSINGFGNTTITLVFNLDKNIDAAAMDVQSAISRAQSKLPPDLPSLPTLEKVNPNEDPIFYAALVSSSLSKGDLYDYAQQQITKRINILPGIAQVIAYGTPRAIQIRLDPQKIASYNLTPSEISNIVRSQTANLSSGKFEGDTYAFTLKPKSQLEKASDYEKIPLLSTAAGIIYLKDVAECSESVADENVKVNFWSRKVSGFDSCVMIAIKKSSDANTIKVAQSIRDLIKEFEYELPSSVKLFTVYDRSITILESINDVKETLIISFVLVVLIVFFFLGRAKDAFIPAVALPIALLMTFISMYILGYSLDLLSLLALTLAIGFMVDDAIVFLENMVRRMGLGESSLTASIEGAKEISFTILAMTLALAAIFIPLVFMGGQIGRVFREFSITIIIAILSSGVVSLTLTPLLCARMLKDRNEVPPNRLEQFTHRLEKKFLGVYDLSLRWLFAKKHLAVLVWVACILGTLFFFNHLSKTFLPIGDSGVLAGVFLAQEGSSPKRMQNYQDQLVRIASQNKFVDQVLSITGHSLFAAHQGFLLTFLADRKDRKDINQVNAEISRQLYSVPGALSLLRPMPTLKIETGGVSSNLGKYAFSIAGTNSQEVYTAAQEMTAAMRQLPGFTSVQSDLYLNEPQFEIEIHRPHGILLQSTAVNLAQHIKDAYSRNYSYLIKDVNDQYQVIVQIENQAKKNEDQLLGLYLRTQGQQLTPASNLVTVHKKLGPVNVNHRNALPAVTISFDLEASYPISKALESLDKTAKSIVPQGLIAKVEGEAQVFSDTMKSLVKLVFVALFIMYVLLGILYESYIHPITVLSALPIAMVGGLATLYILGLEFSLYAFVGLFMLMGIMEKNGIMLIDFALDRLNEGATLEDAIRIACLQRFRPILMTTLAAVMGAVPIAAGWGADGASRMPLGWVLVGGLIVSQLLTLYITPVLYIYMENFQSKVLDKIPLFSRK